jgi:hypothetical protein
LALKLSNAKANQGAYCCKHIIDDVRPICYIAVEEDGAVIFSCGELDHGGSEDWFTAGIWHFSKRPSVNFDEIPEIETGKAVMRKSRRSEWKVVDLD